MLVIHIGPRKTATTYLQSNFYRNRAELLRRGWLYPVVSLTAQNAHHSIAASVGEIRNGQGAMTRRLAKAASVARARNASILLSSEAFRKWKPADYAALAERLGQAQVRIVYTMRDPLDLLLSNWSESVKIGKTASLASYAARHLADPMRSPVVNCLVQLAPIVAAPGLELTVLDFEAIKHNGDDLYKAFGRHTLGLDDLVPAKTKPKNQSFPLEINDFLRLMSRSLDYDPKQADFLFSRRFSRTHSTAEIEAIASTIRTAGSDARQTVALSRDEPWYDRLETEIRAQLGSHIVPPLSDATIFPRGVIESLSYDIDALAAHPEIAGCLDRSLGRVGKARRRWGRTPIAIAWRYVKRLFTV